MAVSPVPAWQSVPVDGDVRIVVGEAHDDAVAPRDDPAAASVVTPDVELGLQRGGNCSHSLISTSGMCGMLPAANAERSTSR